MKFICACSGISAPTQAWAPLGWQALAYAEIEPFAAAILAQRYGAGRPRFMPQPDDTDDPKEKRRRANAIKALDKIEWGSKLPNWGDFTKLRDESWIGEADVLVGGTPCQAFSLAGLRRSLADDRGNLTLEFIRLANAVDDLRRDAGKPPAFVLWENVPGVFSTEDNAFGTFLGGLVGSDEPIVPEGGAGWTDAGVVAGPERVAAWRTLDAQYFGLPQRRRRVFVLASRYPRAWSVADALLPITDSLCGHPPPGRTPRPLLTGGAGPSPEGEGGRSPEAERRGDRGADGGGGNRLRRGADGLPDLAGTVSAKWAKGTGGPSGDEAYNLVPAAEPIPFDTTQITHRENRSNPQPGDPSPTLARAGHPPAIAFSAKDDGGDAADDLAPTLRAMNNDESRANAGGQIAVAYAADIAPTLLAGGNETGGHRPPGSTVDNIESLVAIGFDTKRGDASGEVAATMLSSSNGEEKGDVGRGHLAVAFSMRGRDGENVIEPEEGDVAPALRAGDGGSSKPFVAYALSPGSGSDGAPSAVETEIAPALTATGEADRNGRGLHIVEGDPFAFKPSHFTRGKDGAPSATSPALTADADKGDQDPLVCVPDAAAFTVSQNSNGYAWESGVTPALLARAPSDTASQQVGVRIGTAVRRLTPRECERLQGFPDDFTLIQYSSAYRDMEDLAESVAYLLQAGYGDNEAHALAETPDGPRYRVLGNTMAVKVIRHLGERIGAVA